VSLVFARDFTVHNILLCFISSDAQQPLKEQVGCLRLQGPRMGSSESTWAGREAFVGEHILRHVAGAGGRRLQVSSTGDESGQEIWSFP
jgi:hypothetical protein